DVVAKAAVELGKDFFRPKLLCPLEFMKKRHELGFKGGLFQVPEFKEKDTCHKAPVNPAGALDFANQRTVR
ncbi:MAG TPA: hypothetical protein PKZ53_06095, partial [Acidobacteriota bacterium]|nr:hypothetical protein [Acidobacteriota bacterium]